MIGIPRHLPRNGRQSNKNCGRRSGRAETGCGLSIVLANVLAKSWERSERHLCACVRSLRADLAVVRASIACGALMGNADVQSRHVDAALPLVLNHRARSGGHSSPAPPPPANSHQDESQPQKQSAKTQWNAFLPRGRSWRLQSKSRWISLHSVAIVR